jgi:glycosyltransferase involved in cell wall biosynthesis
MARVSDLKILHVYKDYYPPIKGGIEGHINLLCDGLKSRGVDVQVLVSNVTNKFQIELFNGIPIAKAPQLGRCFSAPLTPTFHLYLRKYGKSADIIHFHHPNPTAEFAYFFARLNKKIVVTYHSDIIRQDKLGKIYSPFRNMFLKASHRIIATSPNYIQTSRILKKFENKCTVIPLGIDVKRFELNGDFSKIKRIKDGSNGRPLILFVGRFRYYKGLHILIQAIQKVNATLMLIGSGPEEARLRALVQEYHLHEKVKFLGDLPDAEVNAHYQACDIFVLPSHLRSEAFGIVQLEAMCCKKPVVCTELGTGTSFVNVHQKSGLIVKPNDIDSLSYGLNFFIDYPEKRISCGQYGHNRVAKLFTAKRMVDSILQLYEEVMKPN